MTHASLLDDDFDSTVRRVARGMRLLAYAMYTASIIGAWIGTGIAQSPSAPVVTSGTFVLDSGTIEFNKQPHFAQFVDHVIPNLVWSSLILAVSLLVQLAMRREQFATSTGRSEARSSSEITASAPDDEMWRPRDLSDH